MIKSCDFSATRYNTSKSNHAPCILCVSSRWLRLSGSEAVGWTNCGPGSGCHLHAVLLQPWVVLQINALNNVKSGREKHTVCRDSFRVMYGIMLTNGCETICTAVMLWNVSVLIKRQFYCVWRFFSFVWTYSCLQGCPKNVGTTLRGK